MKHFMFNSYKKQKYKDKHSFKILSLKYLTNNQVRYVKIYEDRWRR